MALGPIRVVVADDHPLVREGLRSVLETESDVEVIAEACDGREAIEAARKHAPDVMVMDLVMPEVDGVEATRSIMQEDDPPGILVLTSFGNDRKLFPALEAGALGFLLKEVSGAELIGAIRQVARGQSSLSPAIASRLVREMSHESGHKTPDPPLTERENDVLREIAYGHSNEEISEHLFISSATVRTHVHHIFAKLGVERRTQAMLYALKHGIAELPD